MRLRVSSMAARRSAKVALTGVGHGPAVVSHRDSREGVLRGELLPYGAVETRRPALVGGSNLDLAVRRVSSANAECEVQRTALTS